MDDSNYFFTLYSEYMVRCLHQFMTTDKTFVQSAQEVLNNNTSSSRDVYSFIDDIFPVAISNLTKMAFVCQSEIFKSLELDEKLPEKKDLLSEIRKKVNMQNKTIGNSQLYKMIRESLVHTDTAHPNFQITSPGNFALKLKPKGQAEINLQLTNNEMLLIASVFNLNLNNSMYEFKENPKLQQAIDKKKLTEKNLDEYLALTRNGKPIKLDEYQREALLNYFYSYNEILKDTFSMGSANAELFLTRIPFQANEYNCFIASFRAILYLNCLKNHTNMNFIQFDNYFSNFIKAKKIPIREGVLVYPYEDIVSNLIISTFGNLATTVDKKEFNEILKKGGFRVDETISNQIRNSFAHGRFFINPKQEPAVEIYDGRNAENLTHIVTFPLKRMDKVLTKQIMAYDAQLPKEDAEQTM